MKIVFLDWIFTEKSHVEPSTAIATQEYCVPTSVDFGGAHSALVNVVPVLASTRLSDLINFSACCLKSP